MKNTLRIVAIFLILFFTIFAIPVRAASLTNVKVTTMKDKILPGEEAAVTIDFGTDLGSYTVDVTYDSNLFDYVSAEGGTASDNGTRVRVYYFDQSGGSNPRTSVSVTFKAKTGLTTQNPTSFRVTAEGLASVENNVTTTYNDITTAIVKNVTVGPEPTTQPNTTNNNETTATTTTTNQQTNTTTPTTMPKTGGTVYTVVATIITALIVAYVLLQKRN